MGLSVASDKRQPRSFKNDMTLELMGPNNFRTRGTKWCVVESSTYFTFLLVATSSAAAAAFIDVDNKLESVCFGGSYVSHT